VAFVAHHASGADDRNGADQSLKRLAARLSKDDYDAAVARGQTATIDEIAKEILLPDS
jgi:hypothetical protein